jgi:ribose transport system permease protein
MPDNVNTADIGGIAVADARPERDTVEERQAPPGRGSLAMLREALGFRRIGALYIFAAMFLIFALWIPDTFLVWSTWRSMLDTQALNALVAVGLTAPLAAGVFDLAVGAEVGFGGILVAWLLAKQGVPIVPAMAMTLVAGAVIGAISALLVVRARIDSFIATLGMSSVLLALTQWLSHSEQILNLGTGFQSIATTRLLGVTVPFWLMIVVALVVWYLLERTPLGRRVYATGGNLEAARLAGVRTSAIVVLTLALCGALAACAGTLQSSRVATGDPTLGPGFLLPAFAAAFLGSTQFRGGRYNVWGTVVAVYVLATGVMGLQLAGAPVWIPDLFNGLALLIAVGMAKFELTTARAAAIRRMVSRGRPNDRTTTTTRYDA